MPARILYNRGGDKGVAPGNQHGRWMMRRHTRTTATWAFVAGAALAATTPLAAATPDAAETSAPIPVPVALAAAAAACTPTPVPPVPGPATVTPTRVMAIPASASAAPASVVVPSASASASAAQRGAGYCVHVVDVSFKIPFSGVGFYASCEICSSGAVVDGRYIRTTSARDCTAGFSGITTHVVY